MSLNIENEVITCSPKSIEKAYAIKSFGECLDITSDEDKSATNLKKNIKKLITNQGRVFSVSSFFLQYIPNLIQDLTSQEQAQIRMILKHLTQIENYVDINIYQGIQKYKDTYFLLELQEGTDILSTIKIFIKDADSKEETIEHLRSLIGSFTDAIHGYANRYKHYILYTNRRDSEKEEMYLSYLDKTKGYFVIYRDNVVYYTGRCNSRLTSEVKELSMYAISSLTNYFEILYSKERTL